MLQLYHLPQYSEAIPKYIFGCLCKIKKKLVATLAATLLLGSIGTSAAFAATVNNTSPTGITTSSNSGNFDLGTPVEGDGDITPRAGAVYFDGGATGNGQASIYWDYANVTGPQEVRTYVINNGAKTVTYKLKDSKGNIWAQISVDPGKSYTSIYTMNTTNSGKFYMDFNNSDGSKINCTVKVRSDV